VPTRITPEETYAKFRQALKDNNLEMAIEQLAEESEKYEENKQILTKFYNEGKFSEAYKEYPEKIEKSSIYESIASYYYFRNKEGQDFKIHISLLKDINGDWKLDNF